MYRQVGCQIDKYIGGYVDSLVDMWMDTQTDSYIVYTVFVTTILPEGAELEEFQFTHFLLRRLAKPGSCAEEQFVTEAFCATRKTSQTSGKQTL